MVKTRSQSIRNNSSTSENNSDNESKQSLPEIFSRAQMIEFDEGELLNRNRDFEHDSIERRFSDMNS